MQAPTLKIFRSFLELLLATFVPVALRGTASRLAIEDINGTQLDLFDPNTKATLLLFVATDCPISNSYAPEINRIVET